MYPAQGDEIVLVLYEEELLLIFCVTIVRSTTLLWYDDVGHSKRISGLEQTQNDVTLLQSFKLCIETVCQKATQGLCLSKVNRALTGLLLAKNRLVILIKKKCKEL